MLVRNEEKETTMRAIMGYRGCWILALLLVLPLLPSCAGKQMKSLPGNITTITQDNFAAQVLHHEGPALVLFYDEGPKSTDMHNRFIDFAARFGDPVKFCRLKWPEGEGASLYGLEELPTVVLFKNGFEIDRLRGIPPKTKDYMDWNDDVELWILRNALDLSTDKYSATYECKFNNSHDLQFSNY
jgi:hypothetical protein